MLLFYFSGAAANTAASGSLHPHSGIREKQGAHPARVLVFLPWFPAISRKEASPMTTTVSIEPCDPPVTQGEFKAQLCRIRQGFARPLPAKPA